MPVFVFWVSKFISNVTSRDYRGKPVIRNPKQGLTVTPRRNTKERVRKRIDPSLWYPISCKCWNKELCFHLWVVHKWRLILKKDGSRILWRYFICKMHHWCGVGQKRQKIATLIKPLFDIFWVKKADDGYTCSSKSSLSHQFQKLIDAKCVWVCLCECVWERVYWYIFWPFRVYLRVMENWKLKIEEA